MLDSFEDSKGAVAAIHRKKEKKKRAEKSSSKFPALQKPLLGIGFFNVTE